MPQHATKSTLQCHAGCYCRCIVGLAYTAKVMQQPTALGATCWLHDGFVWRDVLTQLPSLSSCCFCRPRRSSLFPCVPGFRCLRRAVCLLPVLEVVARKTKMIVESTESLSLIARILELLNPASPPAPWAKLWRASVTPSTQGFLVEFPRAVFSTSPG